MGAILEQKPAHAVLINIGDKAMHWSLNIKTRVENANDPSISQVDPVPSPHSLRAGHVRELGLIVANKNWFL